MKLIFAALYPSHLNLNGDQANLLVAKKRLGWAGIDCEIASIGKGEAIPKNADLIFIGHGSIAAWEDIEDDLTARIPEIGFLVDSGAALMAVATGHEWAINSGFFENRISKIDRISKFEISSLGELEVLGYLNTSTNAPVIQKINLLIGTQLHGPVFAKNPVLVDQFLEEIIVSRYGSVSAEKLRHSNSNQAETVNSIVSEVWKLERDLASE
jgi:CobQ-like glutamine amidotransferase family enzyme